MHLQHWPECRFANLACTGVLSGQMIMPCRLALDLSAPVQADSEGVSGSFRGLHAQAHLHQGQQQVLVSLGRP